MSSQERPGEAHSVRGYDDDTPVHRFEDMSPVGHFAENELTERPELDRRRFPTFTMRQANTSMIPALTALAVAVFDYGLFGTLLPAMRGDFGWSPEQAYLVNTL